MQPTWILAAVILYLFYDRSKSRQDVQDPVVQQTSTPTPTWTIIDLIIKIFALITSNQFLLIGNADDPQTPEYIIPNILKPYFKYVIVPLNDGRLMQSGSNFVRTRLIPVDSPKRVDIFDYFEDEYTEKIANATSLLVILCKSQQTLRDNGSLIEYYVQSDPIADQYLAAINLTGYTAVDHEELGLTFNSEEFND